MSGLCTEYLPFRPRPAPRLAMDAALPDSATTNASKPRIDDDAFKQILQALKDKLDPQAFGIARDTLAGFSAMSMDVDPVSPRRVAPENVERAVAILRSKNVNEDLISKVCAAVGASVPNAQAMDSALRERNERSYAERFPNAARIGGELAFDAPAAAAKRHREAEVQMSNIESYHARFPEAARLA